MISNAIARLLRLRDVNAADIADGDTLVWDSATSKFVPGSGGGGGGGSVANAGRLAGPDSPPTIAHNANYTYDQTVADPQDFAVGDKITIGDAGAFTGFVLAPGIYEASATAELQQSVSSSLLIHLNIAIEDDATGDYAANALANTPASASWTTLSATTVGKVTTTGRVAVIVSNQDNTNSVSLQGMTITVVYLGPLP